MRRKLFCSVISMMTAIILSYYGSLLAVIVFTAAVGAAAVLLRLDRYTSCLLLGFFLFGCFLMYSHTAKAGQGLPAGSAEDQRVSVRGVVTDVKENDVKAYQLTVRSDGEKILVSYYHEIENPYSLLGREIHFLAKIEHPQENSNPRTFNYSLYLKSKGIFFTATPDNFQVTNRQMSLWMRFQRYIVQQREAFFKDMYLSEEAEALARGILFGDTGKLEEETYEAFRQNGTAHVLAVSGLHVGILYGLFRWLWEKRKSRLLLFVFLLSLGIYGTAACWSVSVRRAVLLIVIALGGELWQRRYDLLTALAGAALVVIIANPYVIFGASFQMSFLAVASMAFFGHKLSGVLGPSLGMVLAVQLGLMPYMAYTFNYISLTVFFSNIPVVLLVSLFVPLGICGFLMRIVAGIVLPVLPSVLHGLTAFIVKVNAFFCADNFLSFDIISPPFWTVVSLYCVCFFCSSEYFFVLVHRRNWMELAVCGVLIALVSYGAVFAGVTPFDQANVVFVDVGQGDCVHLRTKHGKNLLIDGGGSARYDVGKKTLKPYLLKNGFGSVDLAAATHLHMDHYQGLVELSACYPVRRLVTEGKRGDVLRADEDAWVEILWPDCQNPEIEDENMNSLIFKIHWYGVTVLITGDISTEGEAMLLEKYQGTNVLKCDVLKVAHHGSAYSTSDAFLEAVKPSIAVIGVGRNHYGHPSEKILAKLKEKGIPVFRTDLHGAVGVRMESGRMQICVEKD
ncbi:DNA internalization-related competence protein ComEC/Rec2 [Ihubacter sp. rT4E-8]|uniref:DNA internalization-related competence protein ComEC/Rec2 n=1 Tax=Ihubacter sp. rT4E-8 TaxID=3242369 RepID=UPI003CEAA6AC